MTYIIVKYQRFEQTDFFLYDGEWFYILCTLHQDKDSNPIAYKVDFYTNVQSLKNLKETVEKINQININNLPIYEGKAGIYFTNLKLTDETLI